LLTDHERYRWPHFHLVLPSSFCCTICLAVGSSTWKQRQRATNVLPKDENRHILYLTFPFSPTILFASLAKQFCYAQRRDIVLVPCACLVLIKRDACQHAWSPFLARSSTEYLECVLLAIAEATWIHSTLLHSRLLSWSYEGMSFAQ